jgi:hypothetical protein
VSVTASEAVGGAAAQTATFTSKLKPDLFAILTTPGTSVLAGEIASSPLAVKVVLADGITPVAGIAITFTATSSNGGTATFNVCGASLCVITTGSDGTASMPVIAGAAGIVTLSATANLPSGAAALTASLTILPNQLALTTQYVTVFVAEGASVPQTLSVAATVNGNPAPGQPVHWTQAGGYALTATDTLTDAPGTTSVVATLGPLAGGAQASATACAWTKICVMFSAAGVPVGSMQALILIGAQQSITGAAAFTPVVVQVVDAAGHSVTGAAVSIYQALTALDVTCPAQGRCPAAPILASNAQVTNSASDGTITFTPLSLAGVAVQTEIAISVGTQGYATTVLTARP